MLRSFSAGKVSDRSQSRLPGMERRFSHLGLTRKGSLKKGTLKPKLIRRVSSFVGLDSTSRLVESDRELVALVEEYLRDLEYPQPLQKKVVKKFKKYLLRTGGVDLSERKGSISSKTPAERTESSVAEDDRVRRSMRLHSPKEYEDTGAVESDVLAALPLKNRAECRWFLYGQHIINSELFHDSIDAGTQPSSEKVSASGPFLRILAGGFSRLHVSPGRYVTLAPRGAIYLVRRGGCRFLVNGKLEFVIKPGCFVECSVLISGYVSVYRNEEKRAVFPAKSVSLCAVTPRPSDSYMYGAEFGVLSKDDFETLSSEPEDFAKPNQKEKDPTKEKQFDKSAVQQRFERIRSQVAKQIKDKETAEEQLEIKARIQLETECRNAASRELEEACVDGSLPRIEEALLSGADVEFACGELGQRPLHLCTKLGWLDAVEHLIKRGCDASSQDKQGKTALHICAERSSTLTCSNRMALLLLERGAVLDSKDVYGNTPVHVAAARGDLCMIKLFRDFNSGRTGKGLLIASIANETGQSPVDVCREQVARRALKPKTNRGGGAR